MVAEQRDLQAPSTLFSPLVQQISSDLNSRLVGEHLTGDMHGYDQSWEKEERSYRSVGPATLGR